MDDKKFVPAFGHSCKQMYREIDQKENVGGQIAIAIEELSADV